MPRVQVVISTATGVVAYGMSASTTKPIACLPYLEHLDEGNAQVQVSLVAADQAQTEEDANWDNGTEIDATCHGHLLSRIKYGGEAREELRHDGGKDQMPCG